MKALRKVEQYSLNKGALQASGLFNVTDEILLNTTSDKGCSLWFEEGTKKMLMKMSKEHFIAWCKKNID